MFQRDVSVLVIGTDDFGRVIEQSVLTACTVDSFVRHTTWESAMAIWTPRLFQLTDLFILEMFRQYDTGFRAEGLATAALIAEHGAMPLVVSPFEMTEQVGGPRGFIWDACQSDSLADRVLKLLDGSKTSRDAGVLRLLAEKLNRDDSLFSLHR
ncbi:MAG: hypothetical protein IT422_15140 [Pirellulaceae bacterium]|nr:hypothetical protein [Pirellulaceae bacterium]